MATESAINTGNVTVATPVSEGGIVYFAPKGTALPTAYTAPSALDTAFQSLGDLSEDGFTETLDVSDNTFNDMAGKAVLSQEASRAKSYAFVFIEALRASLLKFIYGDANVTLNTAGTAVKSWKQTGTPSVESVMIVYESMSDGSNHMTVIRRATPAKYDDITHSKGSLLSYGMTINALYDSSNVCAETFTDVA